MPGTDVAGEVVEVGAGLAVEVTALLPSRVEFIDAVVLPLGVSTALTAPPLPPPHTAG